MASTEPLRDPDHDRLWIALRSAVPLEALVQLVKEWKAAGASAAEAERRLTDFMAEVRRDGNPDEDDPVLETLDFVVGYCAVETLLFP